jgi:hypothetical protein
VRGTRPILTQKSTLLANVTHSEIMKGIVPIFVEIFAPKIASFCWDCAAKNTEELGKTLRILPNMHQTIVNIFFGATRLRRCPQSR